MEPILTDGTCLTSRRFVLWGLYFAIYLAIFWAIPTTPLSFGCGASVVLLFVFIDAFSSRRVRFPGVLGLSFFVCGLAYAVTVGFFVFLEYPPPPTPLSTVPKPPASFWSALYYLASGEFLRSIGDSIAIVFIMIFQYLTTIGICILVSTTLALVRLRRERVAKWLLLMNSPGILAMIYFFGKFIYKQILTT